MNKPFVERVTSITQGISKQAPAIRFPGQVDDATNVAFNVVDGARKRNGSAFIGWLGGAAGANGYKLHKIERDDEEEYVVVYGRGFFKVFDLGRLELAALEITPRANSYINSLNPSMDDYRLSTIADTTFVVNRKVQAKTDDDGLNLDANTMPMVLTRTSFSPETGASFKMDAGPWKSRNFNYQILEATGTPTSGTFKLEYLGDFTVELPYNATADQIQKALEGNGFDENDFLVEEQVTTSTTTDGVETTRTEFTGNYVDTDLPPRKGTIDGRAVEGLPAFNYGKVIVTGGPIDQKRVQIRISPDIEVDSAIDVRGNQTNADISVKIGDPDDDPTPAFAQDDSINQTGGKITDISFIRNRLAVASDEFISFSRTDDVFAFYREEPPSLIASDAFDIQLAADDVCIIDRMTQFRGAVIVLTKAGQQFELTGLEALSATNVALTATTKYNTQDIKPAKIGERLYIAADGGDSSRVMEYFFSNDAVSNTAIDVTKHVDDLVPERIVSMTANPNRETLYVLTELENDLQAREIVSTCSNSTPLDWDACATWGNTDIPQPFDTAIIPTGCVVERQDDEYNTASCGGGFAAGPGFQTATARQGPCCHTLPPAQRVPCACDGSTPAANCNCYADDCLQCKCYYKGHRLPGCHPILTFIRRIRDVVRRTGDPDVCTSQGACCDGCACTQRCEAECGSIGGTFYAGRACSPNLCCVIEPTCNCCCFDTGATDTSLTTAECINAGGTCKANCDSCESRAGGGDGDDDEDEDKDNGGGNQPGDGYGDPTNEGIEGQIYVYQTYVEGQERKQSAWARWLLGKDRVMDAVTIDDELIILRKQTLSSGANILVLESIDLSEDRTPPQVTVGPAISNWPMTVHLDHMAAIKGGRYTTNDGFTSWDLSESAAYPTGYTDYEIDSAVAADGTVYPLQSINDGQSIRTTANVDLTNTVLLIGRKVISTVKLSESFARDPQKKSIIEGRTTLKKVVVSHTNTYSYDVVTASDETNALTRTSTFTNPTVEPARGEMSLYTQGNTEKTKVTLQSDNPFPACFTSYEIYGLITQNLLERK